MHEQRLGCVAGAVLLGLGVVGDTQRELDVDPRIDIHMAVAVQVLDDRHARLAADALDQALAAARDDDVDRLGRGDQVPDRGAVGGLHELHAVGGQAGFEQGALHQLPQREVGVDRLRAAAQDAGVAALDRERRGFDRHVGAALVDHAEDAQRHPHLADRNAARPLAQVDDLADRVGHRGDLLAAFGHGVDDLRRELEAVDHRGSETRGLCGFDVALVGRVQRGAFAAQQARQRRQGCVARRRRRRRHARAGRACGGAHVGDRGLEIGGAHRPNFRRRARCGARAPRITF